MEILVLFVLTVFIVLFLAVMNINTQFSQSQTKSVRPDKRDLVELYKDIHLQPYGCFTSLDEKFFAKNINPYSNGKVFDSGLVISENRRTNDMRDLIQKVLNNGFDKFAYKMLKKYDNDPDGYSKNMSIIEVGILGKLAGYNYLSVYKINENTRGKIYLSYSPPLDSQLEFGYTDEEYNKRLTVSDLKNYSLTPELNKYTNEQEKAPGKQLACGYPCLPNDKPLTMTDENGVTRQYMCGSVAYPDIKTPPRFAVYKIVEKS